LIAIKVATFDAETVPCEEMVDRENAVTAPETCRSGVVASHRSNAIPVGRDLSGQ